MCITRCLVALSVVGAVAWPTRPALAMQQRDSSAISPPAWRDSARYGGGPSVGPPPSDFTGAAAPTTWCLRATGRASGDFGGPWTETSRGWLRQILSDSTNFGDGWRKVLGGAPRLVQSDSIIQIVDETTCREIAQILNRDVLGWKVGPPPIVIFRVRDYLIAYPSNARRGEFGLAVGMTLQQRIRAVVAW